MTSRLRYRDGGLGSTSPTPSTSLLDPRTDVSSSSITAATAKATATTNNNQLHDINLLTDPTYLHLSSLTSSSPNAGYYPHTTSPTTTTTTTAQIQPPLLGYNLATASAASHGLASTSILSTTSSTMTRSYLGDSRIMTGMHNIGHEQGEIRGEEGNHHGDGADDDDDAMDYQFVSFFERNGLAIPSESSHCQQVAFNIVYSRFYFIFVVILFCTQLAFIGIAITHFVIYHIHTQQQNNHHFSYTEPLWLILVDIGMVVILFCELFLRICAVGGIIRFIHETSYRCLHLFDLILSILSASSLLLYLFRSNLIIISIILMCIRNICRMARLGVFLLRNVDTAHTREITQSTALGLDVLNNDNSTIYHEELPLDSTLTVHMHSHGYHQQYIPFNNDYHTYQNDKSDIMATTTNVVAAAVGGGGTAVVTTDIPVHTTIPDVVNRAICPTSQHMIENNSIGVSTAHPIVNGVAANYHLQYNPLQQQQQQDHRQQGMQESDFAMEKEQNVHCQPQQQPQQQHLKQQMTSQSLTTTSFSTCSSSQQSSSHFSSSPFITSSQHIITSPSQMGHQSEAPVMTQQKVQPSTNIAMTDTVVTPHSRDLGTMLGRSIETTPAYRTMVDGTGHIAKIGGRDPFVQTSSFFTPHSIPASVSSTMTIPYQQFQQQQQQQYQPQQQQQQQHHQAQFGDVRDSSILHLSSRHSSMNNNSIIGGSAFVGNTNTTFHDSEDDCI